MPMAYKSELVPASLLLIWVLAVSAAFQTYRSKHIYYLWKKNNKFRGELKLFAPHAVVHIMFWFRIFFLEIEGLDNGRKFAFLLALTATCVTIIFFRVEYKNTAPDFSRWLKYIITAPLQIAIIAMSVWLRDRSTLIALGGAQACMLLCGVVIEACIQDIYDTNKTGEDANTEQMARDINGGGGEFVAVKTPKPSRHLGSLTAANWVSFDFNVFCSSC